jgi:hypothetical protein
MEVAARTFSAKKLRRHCRRRCASLTAVGKNIAAAIVNWGR